LTKRGVADYVGAAQLQVDFDTSGEPPLIDDQVATWNRILSGKADHLL